MHRHDREVDQLGRHPDHPQRLEVHPPVEGVCVGSGSWEGTLARMGQVEGGGPGCREGTLVLVGHLWNQGGQMDEGEDPGVV